MIGLDVLPDLAIYNTTNRRLRYAVGEGQRFKRIAASEPFAQHGTDLDLGESREMICRSGWSARLDPTPLADSITNVDRLSTKKKVLWVAARWIVARVANTNASARQSRWRLTSMQELPSKSVCQYEASTQPKRAIAARFATAPPLPTFLGATNLDLSPKACNGPFVHELTPRGPSLGRLKRREAQLIQANTGSMP